jgi:predicted DNA-binding protein
MANSKETVGGRVEPEKREWIEREAEQRDRSISYIVNELITEGIERREQDRQGDTVPA